MDTDTLGVCACSPNARTYRLGRRHRKWKKKQDPHTYTHTPAGFHRGRCLPASRMKPNRCIRVTHTPSLRRTVAHHSHVLGFAAQLQQLDGEQTHSKYLRKHITHSQAAGSLFSLTASFPPPFPLRFSPRIPKSPFLNAMSPSSSSLSARMGSNPSPAKRAIAGAPKCFCFQDVSRLLFIFLFEGATMFRDTV